MKHVYFPYLFFVALSVVGCSRPAYVTPDELARYITEKDNGLYKSNQIGDLKIDVVYRPTDLLIHHELNDGEDTARVNALRKKYSSYHYFILSLSRNNKEALHSAANFPQYSDLVQTLSFRMPEYVTLTTSSFDTVALADFMLNRMFGMSSSTDLLFVFDKEKTKDDDWVQFNLNEFGLGTGNQRFRFRTKDIEDIPRIYTIAGL